MRNALHYGDNLEVLRPGPGKPILVPDEVADLIYLDPPFNSQRQYNMLFKQVKGDAPPAQIEAFSDTWQYSDRTLHEFRSDERNEPLFELMEALFHILGKSEMMAYVLMMAPRLLELHRKLKPTGSMFLHCDPVASHYLKLILDVIFAPQNFGNEVIWRRSLAKGDAVKHFGRNHDVLLWYHRSARYQFRPTYLEKDEAYHKRFNQDDNDGKGPYHLAPLDSPNPRPNLTYEYKGYPSPPKGWRVSREVMAKLDADGRLWFPRDPQGRIRRKLYASEQQGAKAGDVWIDIAPLQGSSRERRGYPTQKPLALLERIISVTTTEGEVVFDPFAGCGTAIVAAERMKRKWIGIDITHLAINDIIARLEEERIEGVPLDYDLTGTPKDVGSAEKLFEDTRKDNHKPFEQWAVSLVRGRWNEKKGADRGIDGYIPIWLGDKHRRIVIQVKGGNALTLSAVRDFRGVIEREQATMGLMISQREPTKEMQLEAESMLYADLPTRKQYPRYQIRSIADLLERDNPFELPDSYRHHSSGGVGHRDSHDQEILGF